MPQPVEPIPYAMPPVCRPRRPVWLIVLLIVVLLFIALFIVGFFMYFSVRTQVQISPRIVSTLVQTVSMPTKPVELTVVQRQSAAIPGSNGQVLVGIGDITGGQVLVSVSQADGTMLMPTRSMSRDISLQFLAGSQNYTITAKELKNFLTGDDFAVFTIAPATLGALSETEKIEALIGYVAGLEGATFIRNGQEHAPAEAAQHMRDKRKMSEDHIQTARDFITKVASRSSMNGEAYRVRLGNWPEVTAEELLKAELFRLEGDKPAGPTTGPSG